MGNYNDCCVVSCAFREPYVTHSNKQKEYVLLDKEIFYWRMIDQVMYSEGTVNEDIVSRFQKSLYGFKPHMVGESLFMNFNKVIWLDPSVLPISSVKVLFDSLDDHPMIVRTGEHELSKMCNEKSKKWFGVTDEDIKGVKHIGGTVYGFNFTNDKVREVFDLWKRAEEEGIFGNQDEFMAGHWADEACLALAMHKVGVPQYWEEKFMYLNQKEL